MEELTIRPIEQIFSDLPKRSANLEQLSVNIVEESRYKEYLQLYMSHEINADFEIFGYERSLKENKYFENNRAQELPSYWMIGRSGQGDEWFLDVDRITILFYDHNAGDYKVTGFKSMNISFEKFIQVADVVSQLDEIFDSNDETEILDEKTLEVDFRETLEAISPGIYEVYPYKYF